MKVIAIYSIKGGVGKTAACVNLAYLAAKDGAQTILCDLDPQGSASYYFRIRAAKGFGAKKLLRGGKNLRRNIRGTDYPNLDLLPSKWSFRNLDLALNSAEQSGFELGEILSQLGESYEYVFLDCPANVSKLSENIFNAAHLILIPLIPTTLSMQAHGKLLKFVRKHHPNESKLYSFFSMVEKRKKMHREMVETGVDNSGHRFSSCIPYAADVEKMGLLREPVVCSRPKSVAANAYSELWQEIKAVGINNTNR